jgi:hypothetical protein
VRYFEKRMFLSDKGKMIGTWRKFHNEGVVNCSIRVQTREGEMGGVCSVERRDYA